MRIIFIILLIIHGLIHLMGFAKAFDLGPITQLSGRISKPMGVVWLSACILFVVTAILLLLKKDAWYLFGIIAALISQLLIFTVWQEAKFGTVANVVVLIVIVLSWGLIHFENEFRSDISINSKFNTATAETLLMESDLVHLPAPVQKYLHYTGVINQPKVRNFKVVFSGKMRDKGKDYFPFTSEQYNFTGEPARLFFMKATMFGMTVPGYHRYVQGQATMDIRLFGLFSIVKHAGEVMDKTETVTLFNDMCLLAPATLTDKRIQWEPINDTSAKAFFTNKDITISAVLYFNGQGQLTNFISEDRTSVSDMKQYPFSTPVRAYKNIGGYHLISEGEAVWHYPDGPFTYGLFTLQSIEYNVE